MAGFATMPLGELLRAEGHACACGRKHHTGLRALRLGMGALRELPGMLREAGLRKPFIVSDPNTDRAVGLAAREILKQSSVPYTGCLFDSPFPEPDERGVGALCMAFDPDCDCVLAAGSGVIHDCCKVLAHAVKAPCVSVASAPSMDGYASDSSSMIRGQMKVSLYNACPRFIVADTGVLAAAPEDMVKAGMGDMLAKYVSICEWRISHLVTGEYFCENIAGLMRASVTKLRDHADGILRRDGDAVENMMRGLVCSGVAMSFAGTSRPASGLEHYFSHLWEMKALRGLLPSSFHGTQVGVGVCLTLRLYEALRGWTPDWKRAYRAAEAFREEQWERDMLALFGEPVAQAVISLERRAQKNDPRKRVARLNRLQNHWDEVQHIISEELPRAGEIIGLMRGLGMATTPEEIGIAKKEALDAYYGSREIRDKYLTSSMLWDLDALAEFSGLL